MALAETARLATELTLKDHLSPGLGKTTGAVGKFDTRIGRASKSVGRFAGALKGAAVVGGAALVGGLTLAVKTGIEDLAKLEDATTSVDGAIKQMGLTGQVTSGQVATWANEIETNIHAAFDDKEITAAAATLLRFGKVVPKNLKQSLVVMTDLAAKTGSVDSASTLLAKALADPTKAAGKLARQGIVLTKGQEKQIKAFVKAGKVAEAQKVILDAVAKSTKGAADASQGKYQKALSTLADVSEDARKALAEGFLPVIQRVADKLSKVLADPKAVQSIRDFGKALAGAFDKAVRFAENIDWKAVGDGLKSAYSWGKKFLGAFTGLPPEVKGLLLATAGLSKLTGGAPIKIAVDFAKDALGGVFGHFFDRGSTPANPMWVQQVGGLPGGGGGTPVPTPGLTVPLTGAVVALDAESRSTLDKNAHAFGVAVTQNGKDNRSFIEKFLHPLDNPNGNPGGALTGGAPGKGGPNGPGTSPMKGWAEALKPTNHKITDLHHGAVSAINTKGNATKKAIEASKQGTISNERTEQTKSRAKLSALQAAEQRSLVAFRAGERATLGVKAVTANKLATANAKLDAIRHKKTSFRTIVNVRAATTVSVRDINKKTTTSVRFNTRSINQAF